MPAFNFKKQFAGDVESGKKRQTIRAKRKDGRNPHAGDKLYLYTGMRTKTCRKLGEVICRRVQQIWIDVHGYITVDCNRLHAVEYDHFAKNDGFKNFEDFLKFFQKEHGLPFEGLIYTW